MVLELHKYLVRLSKPTRELLRDPPWLRLLSSIDTSVYEYYGPTATKVIFHWPTTMQPSVSSWSMPFSADVMAVSRLHKPGARHRHTQHFRLSGAGEYMCRAVRALCPVRVRVRVRALMSVCGKFK